MKFKKEKFTGSSDRNVYSINTNDTGTSSGHYGFASPSVTGEGSPSVYDERRNQR